MSNISEEARHSLMLEVLSLIKDLQQEMCRAIKNGTAEGSLSRSLSGWNYHQDVLRHTELIHLTTRGFKIEGTEEFWIHSVNTSESFKSCSVAFQEYATFRQQVGDFLVQAFVEIPKLIDFDNSIVRWPQTLSLGFSNNGQNVCVMLTSCHVQENHQNYRNVKEALS